MSFIMLKAVHLFCAAISYVLFFVRGIWSLRGSPKLQQRWVKVVPHVVDTLLLGSAIALAVVLHVSPLAAPWLLAKIIALLLYIALGAVAIKRGKTLRIRLLAWLAAQLVFFYIVATAITHDPLPWHGLA
jgi:uncharacterized membrane protein SirB2